MYTCEGSTCCTTMLWLASKNKPSYIRATHIAKARLAHSLWSGTAQQPFLCPVSVMDTYHMVKETCPIQLKAHAPFQAKTYTYTCSLRWVPGFAPEKTKKLELCQVQLSMKWKHSTPQIFSLLLDFFYFQ